MYCAKDYINTIYRCRHRDGAAYHNWLSRRLAIGYIHLETEQQRKERERQDKIFQGNRGRGEFGSFLWYVNEEDWELMN